MKEDFEVGNGPSQTKLTAERFIPMITHAFDALTELNVISRI